MMSTQPFIKNEAPDFPESSTINHLDNSASIAPKFPTNFGVSSISNIISQIPDHPVLNINFQNREEIIFIYL